MVARPAAVPETNRGRPEPDQTQFDGGWTVDIMAMWAQMGYVAKGVAVVLFIMSMWSFGVAIERIFTFTQARNQSKLFAPQVAKHLKEGRLKDAIALSASKNYRYSHLAKVVLAGLQEYQFQQESGGTLSREDLMDTVRRSIQRASALTASDLKKGISALATIGSTAPFVGLLGTVVGVITAFQGIASSGSGGIAGVSQGISEALVETALGLVVAIPAVWFYNYLTGRIEYFNVEMDNSSSELVDYFIRKSRVTPATPRTRGDLAMSMDVGGAKGGVKSDINVTPLVDVMLVLLIIMMLVAPLLQQGVNVKLPSANNVTDHPETNNQTVITIAPNKDLYLNAKPIREGELATKVNEALENQKEKVVLIKADEEVEYSAVMSTMDQLRQAGVEDIGLITTRRRPAGGAKGAQ